MPDCYGGALYTWRCLGSLADLMASIPHVSVCTAQMVAQSCFAAVVASWSIVLPMSTATAFKRFQKTAKCALASRQIAAARRLHDAAKTCCWQPACLILTSSCHHCRAAASPRLLWKAIPKISPHIDLDAPANRDFARMLREHSVLFRVLLHLLY